MDIDTQVSDWQPQILTYPQSPTCIDMDDLEAKGSDRQPEIYSVPPTPPLLDRDPEAVEPPNIRSWNAPASQTAANYGDPSDGFWSLYLDLSDKMGDKVFESWKADAEGILIFVGLSPAHFVFINLNRMSKTGLFSTVVAAFILESYKMLSPDSGDTTNAILTQILVSGQLANISNATPLTSVDASGTHPFKPTASAVRVNLLWFLSLVLSLNCALSATLMQQWARRYRELTGSGGAPHKRGHIQAYIFDGMTRFGFLARVIVPISTLLHIAVFLFFVGLVEFLFPIYTAIAYTTLVSIGIFAFPYAILTILPSFFFNCPFGTPLSGITWRLSQLSQFGFLWARLKIGGLFHTLSFNQTDRRAVGRREWRETIENRLEKRRLWLSQGQRKLVEHSAYKAYSTVATNALLWTLRAVDEDKEIEDFVSRIPGIFESRVISNPIWAILPLMSDRFDRNLGSRLCDLLKTCIPETSDLDEKMRICRLRVCVKCLWYFGNAYNTDEYKSLSFSLLVTLASPEIIRCVQAEQDSSIRVLGRCFGALVANRLTSGDVRSPIRPSVVPSATTLACLSAILAIEEHDVELLLRKPGSVAIANMISLTFGEVGTALASAAPSKVRDMVQQTLATLSRALPSEDHEDDASSQLSQPLALLAGSDRKFERALVSYFHGLGMAIQGASPLSEEVRTSCLRMCLKGLWLCGKAYHDPSNQLLPNSPLVLASPAITHLSQTEHPVARITGRCFGALIVSKLVGAFMSPNPLSDRDRADNVELACRILSISVSQNREDSLLPLPCQLLVINFRSVASLMSGEIDTLFTAEGVRADILTTAYDTLHILKKHLNEVVLRPLDRHTHQLLDTIHAIVTMYAERSGLQQSQLKEQAVQTLDQMRQVLAVLLPDVSNQQPP
jgi:hypothetical protein